MKIKIFGCRGSIAIARTAVAKYGGNTVCMTVGINDFDLIIDAGSGLLLLQEELRRKYPDYPRGLPHPPALLLSHLHLDHIIGLSAFAPAWQKVGMQIFTYSRDARPLVEQVFGIYRPPFWPISMEAFGCVECIEIKEGAPPFELGPATITPFAAAHPDKTASFHITDGEKTLVYLLDSEMPLMGEAEYAALVEYCTNADLVVFDAAYSKEDYPARKGWGHSTVEDGIKLAQKSGAKRMLFTHFGQEYSDEDLDNWKAEIKNSDVTEFIFAREGMEFSI
ncbi:MAG: MBL fold metallo-hydrolase [Clostridiales bacterium]|jgi:ribonuclease BN (tRNA processing enzyme)|nr:MBL fold metallo-hydrolase [Clostridiales bacterium]